VILIREFIGEEKQPKKTKNPGRKGRRQGQKMPCLFFWKIQNRMNLPSALFRASQELRYDCKNSKGDQTPVRFLERMGRFFHQLKFLAFSTIILWALLFSPGEFCKRGMIPSRSRCL
jgi:hypothetical protein